MYIFIMRRRINLGVAVSPIATQTHFLTRSRIQLKLIQFFWHQFRFVFVDVAIRFR